MSSRKPSQSSNPARKSKASPVERRAGESATLAGGPVGIDRDRLKYAWAVAIVIFLLSLWILYPELVFQNQILFAGDSQSAFSFATVGQRSLDDGVYPLWNPYVFGGMPSYESTSFMPDIYPVNYVIGLIPNFIRKPLFGNYTWLLIHSLMFGFATFLLLRDRKVHYAPAICAGVLMMWMPNLVAVSVHGHGSQASASAFLPLALLFWDRLWRGKGTVLYACALILVLGSSMLRSHLQISYYTYALVALHWIFFSGARFYDAAKGKLPESSALPRALWNKLTASGRYSMGAATAEFAWTGVVLAVVVAVSLLVSLVLYLPIHEYAQYSIRGASSSGGLDYNYATSWSLHPQEALTFIVPFAFGFGKDIYFGSMPFTDYPNYLGVVVVFFAIFGLVRVRTHYMKFLAFVAVVATFVAFGKFLPLLYDLLFNFAPFFDKFRVPVMVLIVQQLAVIAMFAIGFDAALRVDARTGRKWAIRGLIGAGVLFVLFLASQSFWSGGFAEGIAHRMRGAQKLADARVAGEFLGKDLIRTTLVLVAMFVILFLYYSARRVRAIVFVGLMLILSMADFYVVNRKIIHPEQFEGFRNRQALKILFDVSAKTQYRDSDDLVEFLQQDEDLFRIFPMDHPRAPFSRLFQSNRFMIFDIASIGGYHPAKLALYERFFREGFTPALQRGQFGVVDMFNAKYIVTGAELPDFPRFELVWQGVDHEGLQRYVYRNHGALPRAFVVGGYKVVSDEAALATLVSGGVDLRREVLLEKKPAFEPAHADTTVVNITEYGFNEIKIQAQLQEPGILVLGDVYYPRWVATVDGEETEVLRANYILRAVAVPAGDHEVVFKYDSSLIRTSAIISGLSFGATLMLLVGSIFFAWRGRRFANARRDSDI